MKSLANYVRGDAIIQFTPKFLLHPDQKGYIKRLKSLVHQSNLHRDSTCVVTPRIRCYPRDGRVDKDKSSTGWMERIDSKGDFKMKKGGREIKVSTSLGNHTELYRPVGARSCFLARLFTSRVCWTLGMFTGFATLMVCCFTCRFRRIRYHSTFRVVFPSIEELERVYPRNVDGFIAAPPRLLQPGQHGP